jgi:hypothetical protein
VQSQFRANLQAERKRPTTAEPPKWWGVSPVVVEQAGSVQAFIDKIPDQSAPNCHWFYRGVTKQVAVVNPSVFRSQARLENEKLMFDTLLANSPSEFVGDTTTLDKLVRMQHHGLPTRLLDITSNPLMALFFACDSEDDLDKDGEILCFEVPDVDVKYPDSDRASVIANLARLPYHESCKLDPTLDEKPFNSAKHTGKLLHFIKQEKPYFLPQIQPRHIKSIMVIHAKRSNLRIAAQSGAFLLFGNHAQFETSKADRILSGIIRIPADRKRSVLQQLDHMAINRSTVYPGLESSAAYISKPFPA